MATQQDTVDKGAVALTWEGDDRIPFVSAIGTGIDAHMIIATARAANVPLIDNPLLLADLAELQHSENIPAHLYLAVAQIFACVRALEARHRD